MAKTISELRNQSIQVRDASAAGENTATRVGTVLNDIVGHIEDYENTQSSNNTTQDAKIESVKTSLNTEIARAKTEESNLSNQIGTERTERQAAVSSEETARIQADNTEKAARMAADNTEQDARIKADNAEKTARENADITLRTMIQTEVSDREKAVAAEAARAKAAEQANAQAITDETARAITEEERLQGEINNTNTNVETLDDKVNSNHDHLTDEVARLDLSDNEIKAGLEAETTRAEAAEQANATAIAEEKAAIMGTERIADGAVTTEKLADGAVKSNNINDSAFDNTFSNYRKLADAKVTGEKLTEHKAIIDLLSDKIGNIEQHLTEDDSDSIDIKDNNGNDVVHIDNFGIDAKGVKCQGKDVLTEHQDISGKQDLIPEISREGIYQGNEEQVWVSDDETEEFAKINSTGIHGKSFTLSNGRNIANPVDTVVVDKNGMGDFLTIEDALANIDDNENRHITIIVNTGVYYPAIKKSFNAPYRETKRNITIKGVNRNKCILRNDIGFYDYTIGTDCTPLRLSGNVVIENITIISGHSEWDNYVGTDGFIGRDDYRMASYCVHFDFSANEGDVMLIRNCVLINDHMTCVGFGLKNKTTLRIENTFMQNEQAEEHSPADKYGTIYGHNDSGKAGENQRLEVLNCQLINKTGVYAIALMYANAPEPTSVEALFINNAINTIDTQNALLLKDFPEGILNIDNLSYGNACSLMNKN